MLQIFASFYLFCFIIYTYKYDIFIRADEQTFGAYPSFVSVCFYFWSIPVYWVCVFASLHVTSIRLYSLMSCLIIFFGGFKSNIVKKDQEWALEKLHQIQFQILLKWIHLINWACFFHDFKRIPHHFEGSAGFHGKVFFFQDPRWPPNGGDFVFEYCRLAPELSIVVWQYQCFTILWGMLKKYWIPRVFDAFWAYP